MRETLSFQPLAPRDQAAFEPLYALYRSALPEHEQKTRAELVTMLATQGYLFLTARRAQRLAGFAIVYLCRSESLALLEYLAVAESESERGRGLGASLFARSREHAGERTFLVEMDAPAAPEPATQRRSDFYRRLGCRRVEGLEYILPLPDKAPPPMWLLTLPARGALAHAELAGWLRTLYSEVYGMAQTDPRIVHMLAPLPDPVRLLDLPAPAW